MNVIKQILGFIRSQKRFLITAHTRLDGDSVGCELAVARWLAKMGKRSRIINTGGIPREYSFLPGIRQIQQIPEAQHSKLRAADYDGVIVLDSGGFDHLETVKDILPSGCPVINIDHHPSNDYFGRINWVDSKAGCTAELVYQLIKASGVPLDKTLALYLYLALITDTGNFSFSTTTPRSHLMAADLLSYGINPRAVFRRIYEDKNYKGIRLYSEVIRRIKRAKQGQLIWTEITRAMTRRCRTEPADSEEYLRVLKSIKETRIAVLFKEDKTPAGGIKISIRTAPPIDANRLASKFGGGGHHRAAGCTVYLPLAKAQQAALAHFKKYL